MAKVRIGINGFGRIGRQSLKAIHRYYRESMEVVAINDLFEIEKNANLLKYDTTYGRFPEHIEVDDGKMIVGDWRIQSLAERDPNRIPWGDLGVDVVIESTGIFRTGPQARAHLNAGAKKVVITAPAKQEDVTVVLGVNQEAYDPRNHHVVSNASCTTNCLAPVALVLHRAFGIEKGSMSTVHAYTNDQRILDMPHKDPRRSRAAACNIIPTTTGAAKAVGTVIPELDGRIDGYALRVPVPTVSVVDFAAELATEVSREELNRELQRASEQELRGILAYNEEPLVSSDFAMDPHSAIVEPQFNGVQGGNLAKVVAWYDNEWGYSCRVADLIRLMADRGL
jgi:glyceraldehyde 3-phosphate dehydrogenase